MVLLSVCSCECQSSCHLASAVVRVEILMIHCLSFLRQAPSQQSENLLVHSKYLAKPQGNRVKFCRIFGDISERRF